MDTAALAALLDRMSRTVLAGADENTLTCDVGRFANDAGLPLTRIWVGLDMLHPEIEGRAIEWRRRGESPAEVSERPYSRNPDGAADWSQSPFSALESSGESRLRRRLAIQDPARYEFPLFAKLAPTGATDYVAAYERLGNSTFATINAIYSSWSTHRPDGFTDDDIAALDVIIRAHAAAIRGMGAARAAETLAVTYLGRDAGQRVLAGTIERGQATRINAVLWMSDLRGFTRLVDAIAPEQVLPLVNAYAKVQVNAIHAHGGQVLKFIGDGVLAIFDGPQTEACAAALAAAREAFAATAALNRARMEAQLATTTAYLGLHVGEVFYGNIGAANRLDFTVIGPAVNELARIAAMCGPVERDIVISADFAAAAGAAREQLIALGRHALRGVARAQALFTLDPES